MLQAQDLGRGHQPAALHLLGETAQLLKIPGHLARADGRPATFLDDKQDIGSVCSGGRYDNLAKLFTKQELPGVGASLGLDRLLAAMEEMKLLPTASTPAPVLIVQFDAAKLGAYQAQARTLRAGGIGVEVYPEAKKIGPQLQYAEKRGFKVALIAGPAEFEQGVWKVKNLATRTESPVPQSEVLGAVRAACGVETR